MEKASRSIYVCIYCDYYTPNRTLELMKAIILIIFSFCSFSAEKVWVDYDVSFGKVIRDVDDGFALITALKSPKLEVQGISIGFGNLKNLNFMAKATRRILARTNKTHIPFYYGAWLKSRRFDKTDATEALAAALRKNPLKIMAMGRLTNMAALIKNYPELKSQIKEIIINAGRRLETETEVGRQRVIMPDTNIDDDVESMRYLMNSGVKVTMLPVEIMKEAFVTRQHLKQMRRAGGVSKWMARNSYVWRWIWKFFPNSKGFIPWDVFIVTYLTHREEMKCDEDIPITLAYLKNNTSSLFRKKYKKKYKDFLVASYKLDSPFKGTYCYEMDKSHLDNIVNRWSKY